MLSLFSKFLRAPVGTGLVVWHSHKILGIPVSEASRDVVSYYISKRSATEPMNYQREEKWTEELRTYGTVNKVNIRIGQQPYHHNPKFLRGRGNMNEGIIDCVRDAITAGILKIYICYLTT